MDGVLTASSSESRAATSGISSRLTRVGRCFSTEHAQLCDQSLRMIWVFFPVDVEKGITLDPAPECRCACRCLSFWKHRLKA